MITDLHMPSVIDGVSLAHVLRQMLPQACILVATGRRDEKESRALAELGLVAMLD